MKLLSAYYKNFQNHADTKIVFDNLLDIFQGANEAGKTALLDGLKFLFTDKCRDVKMVKDHPVLIKHGEQSAALGCTFEHNGTEYQIKKTIEHNKSGAIFYKDGDIIAVKPGDVKAEILKALGITEAMLGFLFDAFALSKEKPEDLKKTLQGLFTSSDPEVMRQYLREEIKQLDGTTYMDEILKRYSSGGVEAASKYAIELRLGYKRELRDMKEPEKPSVYPSKDEVEIAKETLEASKSSRNSLAGEIKNSAKRAMTLEVEISQLKEATRPEKPVKPTATLIPIDGLQKSADDTAVISNNAQVALNEWREEKESSTDIGDLSSAVPYLKNMGDRISDQSLKSIEDEISQKAEMITASNEEGESLQDLFNDARGAEMGADRALVRVVEQNENIQSAIDGYQSSLDQWQASIDAFDKSIEDRSEELEKLNKILDGRTVSSIDKTIEELDQEIDEMNAVINAAQHAESYKTRIQEISKEKELLTKKIKNWNFICECLDPKNEKLVALFSSGKDEFDEIFGRINTELGLEVTLRADYTFLSKEYGSSDAMKRVSPSRQLRISAALLIAICHQIGWKTILIDWLDALYGNSKEDMIRVLLGLDKYGMNTLAFCAGPVQYKGEFHPDWAKYVRPVIDGEVVTL